MKTPNPYEFLLSEEAEKDILQKLAWTGKRPLFQYWEEYKRSFRRSLRSQTTINNTGSILRLLLTYSSLIAIEDWFIPLQAEDELHRLSNERKWAPWTFNTHRKNLHSYFLYLRKMNLIADCPIEKPIKSIGIMKDLVKDQPWVGKENVQKTMAYLKNNHKTITPLQQKRDLLFFFLLFTTWARPVELLNLTISSFSNERTSVSLTTAKGIGKSRPFELPPEVSILVSDYIRECSKRNYGARLNEQFFLSAKDGTPWSYTGVRKLCERISKANNIKITPYMFRRNAATTWFEQGLLAQDIMQLMWHTRFSTTMRYVQWTSKMNQAWVGILYWLLQETID